MGQKINPISLRLQTTNRHFDNCWYSNYFYKNLITKDLFIQSYLNSFLKQIKLPTGRYSIHHLQKKTQISSFFCFSKPTREWRFSSFGFRNKKRAFKKSKFFFKILAQKKFKRKFKTKKPTQLSQFYRSLNQVGIYKIQKKLKSFQNFHLWSSFFQTSQILNNKISSTMSGWNLFNPFRKTLHNFKQENLLQNLHKKNETNFVPTKNNKPLLSLKNQAPFFETASSCNSLFLKNLMIYKILKSQKRKSNPTENLKFDLRENVFVTSPKPRFQSLDLKYAGYLESHLSGFFKQSIDLIPFKVKNDWQNASFLAEEIAFFLEKRIPFRRIKTKLVKQLAEMKTIRGVRITCSGRFGGKSKKAQRSKTECLKYGQTSLHVFSSKIDFAQKTAFTSFGSVGVKVWICYN